MAIQIKQGSCAHILSEYTIRALISRRYYPDFLFSLFLHWVIYIVHTFTALHVLSLGRSSFVTAHYDSLFLYYWNYNNTNSSHVVGAWKFLSTIIVFLVIGAPPSRCIRQELQHTMEMLNILISMGACIERYYGSCCNRVDGSSNCCINMTLLIQKYSYFLSLGHPSSEYMGDRKIYGVSCRSKSLFNNDTNWKKKRAMKFSFLRLLNDKLTSGGYY